VATTGFHSQINVCHKVSEDNLTVLEPSGVVQTQPTCSARKLFRVPSCKQLTAVSFRRDTRVTTSVYGLRHFVHRSKLGVWK